MREPTRDEVMAQVRLICQSKAFARLEQRGKPLFLYLVTETLKRPRPPRIKGIAIARDVYGTKPDDFDRKKYSKVKRGIGDLRNHLDEYYRDEAHNDLVLIEIKTGTYLPTFTLTAPFPPLEMKARALHYVSVVRHGMD